MIVLVTGSQGAGKTIILTKYAYAAYKKGEKIYSNYKLSFKHQQLDFEKMMKCKYYNATIVITEAHNWGLDARDAMREPNKTLVKQFIPQIRKQDVTLILDTQRWNQIDKRVRLNSDILVMCRKLVYERDRWREVLQSTQYDKKVPVLIEADYTFLDAERSKTKRFIANDYYGMYDTKEAITTIEDTYDKIKQTDEENHKKKVKQKK